MYRLPMADGSFDTVVLQMVLHYAEDPAAALAEAVRVLRPGGMLVVIDLAPHDNAECLTRLAHRWPGFSDAEMGTLFGPSMNMSKPVAVSGPLEVRLWRAERVPVAAELKTLEAAR
jgi:ArsR family transcriptional regulator